MNLDISPSRWTRGRLLAGILGDVATVAWPDPIGLIGLVSSPVGSSVDFTQDDNGDAILTPDLAGAYGFCAGDQKWSGVLYVFSALAYGARDIAYLRNSATLRSDADRRTLLGNIANAISPAQLDAFNASGVLPSGVSVYALGAA